MLASEKIRALNRFGLGARPGEVLGLDPTQWLRSQVISQPVAIQGLKLETTQKLLEEINSIRRDGMSVQSRKNLRKHAVKQEEAEIMALVNHGLRTNNPFTERLVRFWSNHFWINYFSDIVYLFF